LSGTGQSSQLLIGVVQSSQSLADARQTGHRLAEAAPMSELSSQRLSDISGAQTVSDFQLPAAPISGIQVESEQGEELGIATVQLPEPTINLNTISFPSKVRSRGRPKTVEKKSAIGFKKKANQLCQVFEKKSVQERIHS
jgi:hypothetical protein